MGRQRAPTRIVGGRLVALMNAGVSDSCQTHVRSGDTHLLLRVCARAREGESVALTPDPSTPSWGVASCLSSRVRPLEARPRRILWRTWLRARSGCVDWQ